MESVTTTIQTAIIEKGRWQWQSNPDPFSKSEEPKWNSYSLEDNYLIEKAYYDQQGEVELKDYIISIKHMIQIKKGDVIKQRPIRRIDWKGFIEEMDRSERYLETEKPKTINKVFGSLGDFLDFFSKRSHEILDFTRRFEKIEKLDDVESLKRDIIPKLLGCLEEVVKPVLEQPQDSSLSKLKKELLLKTQGCHKELISLFQKECSSLEEFYGKILRAYTMETCLYQNLNKHLRNESWTDIDKLLPYAFCLCKAFFRFSFQTDLLQENEEIQISAQKTESIMLYRGTAFDESALNCYRHKSVEKYFSWNSVTSTTTSKNVAEGFMYKNADIENKNYPVLIIIEIPVPNGDRDSEYLEWIDVFEYSAKAGENEIILPPGSVFEIMEIVTDKDQKTTIKLKLNNEIKSLAHGGLIMQGALQSKMMAGTKLRITSLRGEDLSNTLESNIGNELIENIEFCLCTFDWKSLRLMMGILPTLKKAKQLKFISCAYNDKNGISKAISKEIKRCNISRVEFYESDDFCELLSAENKENMSWMSLRKLNITFKSQSNQSDDDEERMSQMLQKIQSLTQLTSLTLDFSRHKTITDMHLHRLASKELRGLIQLRSLTLNFSACQGLTDEGLRRLASQRLRYLTRLTSLNLNFSHCEKITDVGLSHFSSDGLRFLTRLTYLALDFSSCDEMTDGGIYNLAYHGLRNLTRLMSLTLNFSACQDITDEGLEDLAFLALRHLSQLESLNLNFSICRDITDEGVSFFSQTLVDLTQLMSLTLDFSSCERLTDECLSCLGSQGVQNLTRLVSLTLFFLHCDGITDEGIDDLEDQILTNLPQLTCCHNDDKTLKFVSDSDCESQQIGQAQPSPGEKKLVFQRVLGEQKQLSSYEEFLTLASDSCDPSDLMHLGCREKLQHLEDPTVLTLSFPWMNEKADRVVIQLSEKLKSLARLQCLTLNFDWSFMEDNDISRLASQVLKNLPELEYLTLNFFNCSNITDKGLNNLASQGLRHLTGLKHLTLDLSHCEMITDKGVCSLFYEGIINLSQLESLVLSFAGSEGIAESGVNPLSYELLKHLEQLSLFILDFSGCDQISDSALQSVAKVLGYLDFYQPC